MKNISWILLAVVLLVTGVLAVYFEANGPDMSVPYVAGENYSPEPTPVIQEGVSVAIDPSPTPVPVPIAMDPTPTPRPVVIQPVSTPNHIVRRKKVKKRIRPHPGITLEAQGMEQSAEPPPAPGQQ